LSIRVGDALNDGLGGRSAGDRLLNARSIIIAVGIVVISTADAHAYLDPGTGSMILQVLVGAVAAVGAGVGIYWRRLKAIANDLLGKNTSPPPSDDHQDNS
jgi:hypothetical protein